MKKKTFLTVCILVFLLICGSFFTSCATLKQRNAKEDMIMYMMLKDASAMHDVSNENYFMYNQ